MVGWLVYALCMVCGAGVTGPVGFRYWRNPGAFGAGAGLVSNLHSDRFLAWLSTLISALFTYQGVELVGISCGESTNPRKTVPAAIRKVIWRIAIFYIGCVFFMTLLIPYNDPKLDSDESFAASSPFIVAMNNSGTKILPDIFNAVILMAIISAANSNVYSGSRILYGMGQAGAAPKVFTRTTKHGIPYVAIFSTAAVGALGYLLLSKGGTTVFNWLLNITAVSGLITWANISFSHIRFLQILKSRGISREDLPFKASGIPFVAYYGFIFCTILAFIQGYSVFFSFNTSDFFTYYISVILFVFTWIAAQIYFNGRNFYKLQTLLLPIDECDIDSGVRDVEVMVWNETPPKNLWEKFWVFMS